VADGDGSWLHSVAIFYALQQAWPGWQRGGDAAYCNHRQPGLDSAAAAHDRSASRLMHFKPTRSSAASQWNRASVRPSYTKNCSYI